MDNSKSGFALRITSAGWLLLLTGRLGIEGCKLWDGGGGFQRGFTPRCDIEVKVDLSDSAGLRAPGGISSYELAV